MSSRGGRALQVGISAVLWIAAGCALREQLLVGYGRASWQISEWLISYRGGFVRRGFWGEIFWQVHDRWGVPVYITLIAVSLSCAAALIAVFVTGLLRAGVPLVLAPMPFFLGFPFLSNEWLRKDTLLVLLLIACLVTMRGRLSWQRIVLLNVLCIVGILTHEMFIFVGVIPIVALAVSKLRSDDLRISQSIVRVGTLWSPTFLTTAAVVVNKGSSVQAEAIWRSWRAVPLPDDGFVPPVLPGSGPQAAVESLTWTVSRGFDITKGSLKVVSYHIPALLAWPLTIMIVVIVSVALVAAARRSVRAELNSPKAMPWEISQIACAYLLGLASLLPLFVIGVDYGRWIFMWVALSTAILLFAEKQPTSLLLNGAMKSVHTWLAQRNHLGRAVAVMNQYFQWAVRRPLLWVLLAPLMAVPPAYWQAYVQITPVATIWRTFMG